MKLGVVSRCFAAVAVIALAMPAGGRADSTYTFDSARRAAILDGVKNALGAYIDPRLATAMRRRLDADRGALVATTDERVFAKAVSDSMQAVAHDKHLNLYYVEHGVPNEPSGNEKPTAAQLAHADESNRLHNGGIRGSYWLPGNIGYLNLSGFPGGTLAAKRAIDAAMSSVGNTDALIIDLRRNHGGNPDSLDYWMGYFFSKPTELTSIHWLTPKPHVDRQFSAARVAGKQYDKAIYVLTSARTFSCGEQFAYDMQSLHRATLVGETTGGAANPGDFNPVDERFAVFVPTGRAYNPYTKTNWEGTGVKPEVAVAAPDALLKAYTLALKNSSNSFDELVNERADILKDPASVLKQAFPMLDGASAPN